MDIPCVTMHQEPFTHESLAMIIENFKKKGIAMQLLKHKCNLNNADSSSSSGHEWRLRGLAEKIDE